MSAAWNKQDWIKNILSKSGTEITKIKDVKSEDFRKMVYYTSFPVLMSSEQLQNYGNLSKNDELTSSLSAASSSSLSSLSLCSSSSSSSSSVSSSPSIIPINNSIPIFTSSHFINEINLTQEPLHIQQQESHPLQQRGHQPQHHQVQDHQQQVKKKVQYKCVQCNMDFGSKSAHISHSKFHSKSITSDNDFKLNSSGLELPSISVSSASSLVASNNLNSVDPYKCDVCNKTFAVPARLIRHYRTHTGERPFECEFCHKMFSVKENLQVHRRIHTKERPYKCDVCGRAFEHSGKLHRHMRIHTGERPHKCTICSKTFIQSGQLVIHMRTHTGEKPYKCKESGCGKGFTCSKQLKVHSRTHTGEKPYHCDICFRDFGYNHVLKLHRVQHYGSKCYKCTICDETFKSKKEMECHIKGHANELPDDDVDDNKMNVFVVRNHESDVIKLNDNCNNNQSISTSSPSILHTTIMPNHGNSHQLLSEIQRESSTERIIGLPATTLPSATSSSSSSSSTSSLSSAPILTTNVDDLSYYNNMYTRFEQNVAGNYGVQSSGVNPVLLAAVSMATSSSSSLDIDDQMNIDNNDNVALKTPSDTTSNENNKQAENITPNLEHLMQNNTYTSSLSSSVRNQNYFVPAPKVAEFKCIDSARSNELVKRVEAALASAEPMLTPPRSSPESPERAFSPDELMMADRDIMSLPLRKRKLIYLKENQNDDVSTPVMRINSVIQFAKAS